MRKIIILLLISSNCLPVFAQPAKPDSTHNTLKLQKDSTLRALFQADSLKTEKESAEKEKMEKLIAVTQHPVLNAGDYSGVIPVKDPTEIPDPTLDYKLLFEITANNPDSLAKDLNASLV